MCLTVHEKQRKYGTAIRAEIGASVGDIHPPGAGTHPEKSRSGAGISRHAAEHSARRGGLALFSRRAPLGAGGHLRRQAAGLPHGVRQPAGTDQQRDFSGVQDFAGEPLSARQGHGRHTGQAHRLRRAAGEPEGRAGAGGQREAALHFAPSRPERAGQPVGAGTGHPQPAGR